MGMKSMFARGTRASSAGRYGSRFFALRLSKWAITAAPRARTEAMGADAIPAPCIHRREQPGGIGRLVAGSSQQLGNALAFCLRLRGFRRPARGGLDGAA